MNEKPIGKKIPFADAVFFLLEQHERDINWLGRMVGMSPVTLYCLLQRDKLSHDKTEEIVKVMGDLAIDKVRRETKQP
jgi:hypothetical protein